jgi:serine/threonine-protein kinase
MSKFMTTHYKFIIMILFVAANSCKKDYPQPVAPQTQNKWVVTTLAGEGTGAFDDGPLLSAKFKSPTGVTVAADGTLFVADFGNHRIRKISEGLVSTIAGNDEAGIADGHGITAQLESPYHIGLDKNGNLYILDQDVTVIRKISSAGDVSVYAGVNQPGFANGPALTARFQTDASAIIADQSGNIYIGDTFNNSIRKINPDGQVSTFAGMEVEGFRNGDLGNAQFRYPVAIAFNKPGDIFVADEGNFCIRKITVDGMVSTFSGSGKSGMADGDQATAQFYFINDMVADDHGNLFVADDNRVRKITADGTVSTIAGGDAGYQDGDGVTARFHGIGGLGIDASGHLYVADIANNRIREISFQ